MDKLIVQVTIGCLSNSKKPTSAFVVKGKYDCNLEIKIISSMAYDDAMYYNIDAKEQWKKNGENSEWSGKKQTRQRNGERGDGAAIKGAARALTRYQEQLENEKEIVKMVIDRAQIIPCTLMDGMLQDRLRSLTNWGHG